MRLVALSGSVAALCRSGCRSRFVRRDEGRHAWSVTLAVVLLARLRRRRVICANFVMADTDLTIERGSVFGKPDHQLVPLIGEEAYRELFAANPFVGGCTRTFQQESGAGSFWLGMTMSRMKRLCETCSARRPS